MKYLYLILLVLICSCSEDEKTVETATNNRTIGAYVRTTETFNADFAVGNAEDVFSIEIETHDELNGQLLDAIEVFLSFKKFGQVPSSEVLFQVMESDIFEIGEFGKPRAIIAISFEQASQSLGLQIEDIECKDQFEVRLNYKLLDGRSFTTGQSSSKILAADDFWSSPFCYTINVIEPIEDCLLYTSPSPRD